jgi:hypothetical protein
MQVGGIMVLVRMRIISTMSGRALHYLDHRIDDYSVVPRDTVCYAVNM